MTTVARIYHKREAQGTALSGFIEDLVNPREAVKEGVANGFTWVAKAVQAGRLPEPRPLKIRLHESDINGIAANDLQIEDPGLGFTSFGKIQKSGNLATNEEEAREMQAQREDPDYIGRFGVGLNGLLSLSETGEIQIKTVRIDEYGRTSGWVCELNYVKDEFGNKIPQYSDPDIMDSKYIMKHIGTIVTIRNLTKRLNKKTIISYLSQVFYRKFWEGYNILVADLKTDTQYEQVQIPAEVCCEHEALIGNLSNGYPVYADIHPAAATDKPHLDLLIKKVGGFGVLPVDRKAIGYVWTSGLLPQMGRGSVRDNTDSPYTELCKLVDDWCEHLGIPKASDDHSEDKLKNEERLKEMASQMATKWFMRHPELVPPEMRAKLNMDDLNANTKAERGWNKKRGKKSQKKKVIKAKQPSKKYKTHKHHNRTPILTEGDNAQIELGFDKEARKGWEICWIDPVTSMLIVNSAYPNSALYQMCYGNMLLNTAHYLTYVLMAIIRLGYRDQELTAHELLKEMAEAND